jgi:trehalose 6-phosphate phosphatase
VTERRYEQLDNTLDSALNAAVDRLARVKRLLVALDFDGTLAPEVDDPLDARALPEATAALLALRELPGTTIALVSGRSLESLAHVGQLPEGTPLIGSHGLEVLLGRGVAQPAVDDADRARVRAVREQVAPLVAQVYGAWIEDKPAGFAVHSRVVERGASLALDSAVRERATAVDPALTVREGKNVVEFAVRDATKGDGLLVLREHVAADAVLFAGDDVTDEDALRVLRDEDVGIKVGSAPSIAEHRVADPQSMAGVLAVLAVRRHRSLSATTG